MKKIVLICSILLVFISACSSKQVMENRNEIFVGANSQLDDEISSDVNLLSELEEFEKTVRNDKKSKKMVKLIDKYIKAVLRRAYNKDVASMMN